MASIEPQGYGDKEELQQIISTQDQEWVCGYLDRWFSSSKVKTSTFFKGALSALSSLNKKNNADWLAQSAHSMREIFYTLGLTEKKVTFFQRIWKKINALLHPARNKTPDKKTRKEKMKENIAITQEEKKAEEIANLLNKLYNIFTNIAHHFRYEGEKVKTCKYLNDDFGIVITDIVDLPNIYEQIIEKFVFLLKRTSENILEIHRKIDAFITQEVRIADKRALDILIHSHVNARDYFFAKAPIEWISWLCEKGFFNVLNKEAEDKTRYSFRMPELSYIIRVVEANGDEEKVIEIMDSVECVKNFNPEVVDQFLWISQKLSTISLVKIIPKIKRENWIGLMKGFKPSGYSYNAIVKKVAEGKEFESLLLLAEILLTLDDEKQERYSDNYFSLNDVAYTEIFDALADLEGEYAEKGIEFILDILKGLVKEKSENDHSAYAYDSGFRLFDVDLFDMTINKSRRSNDREDLKSLIAALIELIERRVGQQCKGNARKVYDEYFANLPDTYWMWRIKIFAMHFCPEIFEVELKKELTRFLSTERYNDFLSGTPEFYKILKIVFPNWTSTEKRDFVKKVLDYFMEKSNAAPEEEWIKDYGWRVLSSISAELTEEEKKMCEAQFGKAADSNYDPEPSVGQMRGGMVQSCSPVEVSEKDYKDILDLIKDLKSQLSPETLKESYKNDDFLKPRNAEGVGNALKEDMKQRMQDYLAYAQDFLDPALSVHYTFSFLCGVKEYLGAGRKLSKEDWDNLFKLFKKIVIISRAEVKENIDNEDWWLARWTWVEKIIADILKYFSTKAYADLFVDKRVLVLSLLGYLLESEDPKPEHEAAENGDLFHIAINSTRGVAFQAFVNFVYEDGENLKDDVLELYKKTIGKASLSMRFIIGRYLASFYYRDKEKIGELFEEIFPKSEDRYEDFFAAWEGYLASILYKEMFEALSEYYDYALDLDRALYPERLKVRDFDGGVATHLALAFAHFDEVQYTEKEKHPLLEKLWGGNDTENKKEFVSFLGRGIISNGKATDKWFKEQNVKLEKLKAFWILILGREDLEPEVYATFGFWVNHKKDIFEYGWLAEMMAATLQKSRGKIEWGYGILARMEEFTKANPEKALIILEEYLLEGILGDSQGKNWFYVDDEKVSVFKELYKAKPEETKVLIDQLLEKGDRTFWPLKDIIPD